jgi:hypothetical protein
VMAAVDPLRAVRSQFGARDAVVDEASALCHLKAEAVLAASRRPRNERNYLAALNAVSDSSGGRAVDENELDKHLAAASALSDLAEVRLAERGVNFGSPGFEELFVKEIADVTRQFGLPYHDNDKGA